MAMYLKLLLLTSLFTATRAWLTHPMHRSRSPSHSQPAGSALMRLPGQRIVARLQQRTDANALRQEVECVEPSESDVLSRLNAYSNIVGESCVVA